MRTDHHSHEVIFAGPCVLNLFCNVNTSDSKLNSKHHYQQTNMLCKLIDLGVDVLTAFLFASFRDVVHCCDRSSLGIGGSTVITLYILHLHL